MTNRFQPLNANELLDLIAVARREKAATVWIQNGMLVNLYTGELSQVHIAIHNKRIAYVGNKEPMIDESTQVVDGTDLYLVPGYIEPHAHPFQLYHPLTLADYVLSKGTTTYIGDNLLFYNYLQPDQWLDLMEEFAQHPVKILWWSRLDPQSSRAELVGKYKADCLRKILSHPLVMQAGELTDWFSLLKGDLDMAERMAMVKELGKRIEGHAPGASEETIIALSAAGVTADHEGITAEEVLRRLRAGMYVPLRHSSIRQDLPVLLQGLKDLRLGWERLMFTTDGSTPPFIEQGFTDTLINLAIEHGIEPFTAYRMASLNVATYYGLEEHIGAIAPGRLADILFLRSLHQPTPVKVMVEGELLIDHTSGQTAYTSGIEIPWQKYDLDFTPYQEVSVKPESFQIPWTDGEPFPVIHMLSDVITVQQDRLFPVRDGFLTVDDTNILHIALLDARGRWITRGLLSGFAEKIGAIASTYTASMDMLVIGSNFQLMQKACEYVAKNSGIVIVEEDEMIHLPLPIGGGMSNLEMSQLIAECNHVKDHLAKKGFHHGDIFYCLLFLSSTHLPKLRLTEKGILSIKEQKILIPSAPL